MVNEVAPYLILCPRRIHLTTKPEDLQLNSTFVTVQTQDKISLRGYWVKSKGNAFKKDKVVMILIHGIGGCKEHFLGLAQKLSYYDI